MKKILLPIILLGFTTVINAQWNSNGNNSTTGSILLKSDSYVQYAIERGNGAKSSFGITSNTHDGFLSSSGNLKFLTNNNGTSYNTSMLINSIGNIGVGTTNPTQKLEVKGNLLLKSDSYVQYAIERGNGAKSSFGITSNTHDGFLSSSGNLKFLTNNNGTSYNTSMLINSIGNIGIGTTNPNGWKLSVNGKIRAKEIKVETGWSDFVFFDDYQLPTLQEVENHINKNGHLKDIPSAKEVEKNGIFLGQMDSKLLQKIEELTLYTIQQQKEIEELKSLVKKLIVTEK